MTQKYECVSCGNIKYFASSKEQVRRDCTKCGDDVYAKYQSPLELLNSMVR